MQFQDLLITDSYTKNSLSKELTEELNIQNRIHIALHNARMAIRILKPQQIQCFEYDITR